MKRVSPLQVGEIGKAFSLSFILISVLWGVVSFILFGDIYVSWFLFAFNLAVSGISTFLLYRYRYRTTLEYDSKGFHLRRGNEVVSGKWQEFNKVSLFHKGRGDLCVRLYYKDNPDEYVELPAASLGLDPSEFRFEVMRLVEGAKQG